MPTLVRLAVFSLLAAPVPAQGPLFAEVGEPLPDGMGAVVAAADYEGDGDDDLFTTVGVFLNDGGFFRPGPSMPPSFDPWFNVRSIAVADFTGDGLVDVLVGRLGGSSPGLVLHTAPSGGGTTFTAGASAIAGRSSFTELTVADFDGDGDVDVVGADNSTVAQQWDLLLNDGTGTFSVAGAGQWPIESTTANWLGAGDFDGDGLIDVFVARTASPAWRRNLGGGAFSANQTGFLAVQADYGVVGDFDDDGFDDVRLVTFTGLEVSLSGSPTGPTSSPPVGLSILGAPPVAGDFDGDGDDDLLHLAVEVGGSLNGELFVRAGSPAGLGAPTSLGQVRLAFGNPKPYQSVALLDADADGDPDPVIAPGGNAPWMLLNDGTVGATLAPSATPAGYREPFAPPRDVDGDGDADLVRASLDTGVVSLEVHRNDGRGQFATPPVPAGTYASVIVGRAHWADLDGDGDDDLWVEGFSTVPSRALLNDGSGSFSLGASINGTGSATAVAFADVDGDQILDVIQGRPATIGFPAIPQAPLLIRGQSVPNGVAYALPVQFGLPEVLTDIEVFDLASDGDQDLVVGTASAFASGPPRLYENDGAGNLISLTPFSGVAAATVAVGDVNDDGCEDLVLGNEVWLCQGANFAPQAMHAAPIGAIALADADEDGDLDLIDDAGRWYAGDGTGSFAPPVAFVPYPPEALNSGGGAMPFDIDTDGDLDMIGPGRWSPGHFAIYRNLLRHAAPTTLATPGQSLGIAVFGQFGEPWFLAASLPATGPLVLPPFGTLFLDPVSAVVLNAGTVPASGRSDVSFAIPGTAGGLSLSWQALIGPQLSFSNAFDTPIRP